MKTEIKNKICTVKFDGIHDFVNFARSYNVKNSHARTFSNNYNGNGFCGYSYDEMIYLAANGWSDGVKEIDMKVKEIESHDSMAIDLVSGVTGDYFDVGKVLAGEPECWWSMENTWTPQQEINVIINVGGSADIRQDVVYNRGAAICAAINKLRKKYIVNIKVSKTTTRCGGMSNYRFNTFRSIINVTTNNSYSMNTLAFLVANASYHRRGMFALLEYCCEKSNLQRWVYGYTGNYETKEKNEITFPFIYDNSEYNTLEKSVRQIESIINKSAVA